MRNRAEDQIVLALIRHGETEANARRRYLGKTDESLSERGKQLLLSYKEQNLYPKAAYLFVSPMKRCVETAKILYPTQKPIVFPEWAEMDFGRFEYKNYEELKDDPAYQQWIDSGGMSAFPGGESREAFVRRCGVGFRKMFGVLQEAPPDNQGGNSAEPVRAAAIVHGGTIMALLSSYAKGDCQKGYFDYQTANGRGYLCRIGQRNRNTVPGDGKEEDAAPSIWIEEITEI